MGSFCKSGSVFVTNHVLSGALIGRAVPNRLATAFALGLGSHLVLDALPHWGCDLGEPDGPARFLRVARRDGLLGLGAVAATVVLAGRGARTATLAAVAGAVLLDLDKPCQHFFGVDPFPDAVSSLHRWVQNESPRWMPAEVLAGVVFATSDGLAARAARARIPSGSASPPGSATRTTVRGGLTKVCGGCLQMFIERWPGLHAVATLPP